MCDKPGMTKNGIEVRVFERRHNLLRATEQAILSDVKATAEQMLDTVTDQDGHEPSMRSPRSWMPADRDAYRVALTINGTELELQDVVCQDCHADLDARPGWAATGADADLEIRCGCVAGAASTGGAQ